MDISSLKERIFVTLEHLLSVILDRDLSMKKINILSLRILKLRRSQVVLVAHDTFT
ncbi:MAG: hypothetical protein AAFW70_08625 [Cyanobacteria bacterium J06635_10]